MSHISNSEFSSTPAGKYQQARMAHWNLVHKKMSAHQGYGAFYQQQLTRYYKFLIPPGLRLLEIGCGQGDLLAALHPSKGVGIDFSTEAIQRATHRHPDSALTFIQMDAHASGLQPPFDAIILSDLVNDLWDVQTVFEHLHTLCSPQTRLIINSYSHLWEIPLQWGQLLGLSKPNLEQNWFTVEDITNLLALTGFEVIHRNQSILMPFSLLGLSTLCNRFLVHLWPFQHLALTNFITARARYPMPTSTPENRPLVSVIVPARNEAGNIEAILQRIPEMGRGTELIFVEGHSKDDTYPVIEAGMARYPERNVRLFQQTGKGKGDAVRLGFEKATGDILMILDADLTVPPETLPRFFDALASGQGEFINGVRLIYPLEHQAMRKLNKMGNKFFSLAFTWLLGQPIKDTLCGTKVLWKKDYEKITANRQYFGDFDPFGDFDLLFGAAKLNLKIVDLPIRYRARTYGETNIDRWRHGWLLLRMVLFAARRLKFI